MFPVYRYTNSQPRRDFQPPSKEWYIPRWDSMVPQSKADPMGRPLFGPWPHDHGCHDLVQGPAPFYPCHYPYSYGYRPPQAHFPLSPPPYPYPAYGAWPMYPDPYAPYLVPPPPYSMGQPRQENENTSPHEHHCCGCPNHPCHGTRHNNVKGNEELVGEHDNKSDQLQPTWLKEFPYPVMWIPTEHAKATGREKESDEAAVHKEPAPAVTKEPPVHKEPAVHRELNIPAGRTPLDMRSIRPMLLGGSDGNIEGNKSQSPFPIIWMPYESLKNNGERNEETNVQPKQSDRADDNSGEHVSAESDGHGNATLREKEAEQKSNPGDQVDKELAKGGAEKKPSSPKKSTKLPPVCLRVDPLPKSRGKGSSRSPSPPKCKEEGGNDAIKLDANTMKTASEKGNEQQTRTRNIKVIEVKEAKDGANEIRVSLGKHEGKERTEAKTEQDKQCKEEELVKAGEENPEQANRPEKKILSGAEAAAIIQSTYRGYELRRCEPLKKLKHVAKVQEKAAEIRNRIEAVESCHGGTIDVKEKVILGETIMKLLLKLDTIQGLHWSLRDMRKSVAKELIILQEKLDALTTHSPASLGEKMPASSSQEEGPLRGATEVKAMEKHGDTALQELSSSPSPTATEVVSGSENEAIKEANLGMTAEMATLLASPENSSHEEGLLGGETEAKTIEQHCDYGSQEPSSGLHPVMDAVPGSEHEAREDVHPGLTGKVATPLAGGCLERETTEVDSLMERGDSDKTQKDCDGCLSAALEPSFDDWEMKEAGLVGAPDGINETVLSDKVNTEQSEHVTDVEPMVKTEGSMLGSQKELERGKFLVADEDVSEALNMEVANSTDKYVFGAVNMEALESQAPTNEDSGSVVDVNVVIPGSSSTEFLQEEAETFRDGVPIEPKMDSDANGVPELLDLEVVTSDSVTCRAHNVPEASKEGTRLCATEAEAVGMLKEVGPEPSEEEAFANANDEENGTAAVDENGHLPEDVVPEEEENNRANEMEKTDDETIEMNKEPSITDIRCLVESSTALVPEEEENNNANEMEKTDDETIETRKELTITDIPCLSQSGTAITSQKAEPAATEHGKPDVLLVEENPVNVEKNKACCVDEVNKPLRSVETDIGVDGQDINTLAIEESKKLRDVLKKLINVGKEQEALITNLNMKVKDLEKKLARRRKLKTKRCSIKGGRVTCGIPVNGASENPVGLAS